MAGEEVRFAAYLKTPTPPTSGLITVAGLKYRGVRSFLVLPVRPDPPGGLSFHPARHGLA